MMEAVSRKLIDAFYEAYAGHHTDALVPMLHDDVTWTISGPVDVLPFCGVHCGKQAVVRLVDQLVPNVYRVVAFSRDSMLIDGNRVATLSRISARRCVGGRVISYRLAHFLHFRDGKLVDATSIIDSFDAAEQILGHTLDAYDNRMADMGSLVSV